MARRGPPLPPPSPRASQRTPPKQQPRPRPAGLGVGSWELGVDPEPPQRGEPSEVVHEKSPAAGLLLSTREDAMHPLASLVSESGLALLGRLLRRLLGSLLRHVTCPPLRQGPFVLLRIVQGLEVRESSRVLRAVCPLARRTAHQRSRRVGCGSASCVAPHGCLTGR